MNKKNKFLIIALTCVFLSLAGFIASAQENPWDWYNTSGEEAAFLFGIGLTVCLVLIIIPLIIAILVGIWIYKDAEKRGKSGALWLILLIVASIFFSFIGFIIILVIWLATRPPIGARPEQQPFVQQQGRVCTNCGRPIPMDAQVCPYCGKDYRMK
jgi:Na+/H+-dicarboxylate symporter